MEILALLAVQAFSYKEIGQALGIAEQTVKNHMRSAFERTGARDRLALVVMAGKKGWV